MYLSKALVFIFFIGMMILFKSFSKLPSFKQVFIKKFCLLIKFNSRLYFKKINGSFLMILQSTIKSISSSQGIKSLCLTYPNRVPDIKK